MDKDDDRSSASAGGQSSPKWTPFERECLDELEMSERDSGQEEDGQDPRLWQAFENHALAISKLYRGQTWTNFQQAASTATELYKDCVDCSARSRDAGVALGRRRALKDILAFLTKAPRKSLSREGILAYLTGKTPPVKPSAKFPTCYRVTTPAGRCLLKLSPPLASPTAPAIPDSDLVIFREALQTAQVPSEANPRSSPHHRMSPAAARLSAAPSPGGRPDQLSTFFAQEWSRHHHFTHERKRGHPGSTQTPQDQDGGMDLMDLDYPPVYVKRARFS